LAFFIICIMQWPIGPVEVIALIVFIGYAVTYSLHMAHKYGDEGALNWEPVKPEMDLDAKAALRYQRTGFALKSLGSAALGSAITTCGCSVFLLFCTLTIFQKLGGVVLAVTVMSIVTALGPLPAMLLMCGPLDPGRRCLPWTSSTIGASEDAGEIRKDEPVVPSQPQPGDGVIVACSPKYAGDPVIMATKVMGMDGSLSGTWHENNATGAKNNDSPSPISSDAVHIDVSDREYEICEEATLSPVNARQAKAFSILGGRRRHDRPRPRTE
jgi:hypothetical protein